MGRRHPYQVFLAGTCVVSGLGVLLAGAVPGSIVASMPTWLGYAWAGAMLASGLLIVAAALVRTDESAMVLEQPGHGGLGLAAAAYAAAVFNFGGARGFVAGSVAVGLSLAAFWRLGVLICRYRRARAKLREQIEREDQGA